MNDVALPQNSKDVAIRAVRIDDDNRANVPSHQNFHRLGQGPVRLGADYTVQSAIEARLTMKCSFPSYAPYTKRRGGTLVAFMGWRSLAG